MLSMSGDFRITGSCSQLPARDCPERLLLLVAVAAQLVGFFYVFGLILFFKWGKKI